MRALMLLAVAALSSSPSQASEVGARVEALEQSLRASSATLRSELLRLEILSPECLETTWVQPKAWSRFGDTCRVLGEAHTWIDKGPWVSDAPTVRPAPVPRDPERRAALVQAQLQRVQRRVDRLAVWPPRPGSDDPATVRFAPPVPPPALSDAARAELEDRDTYTRTQRRLTALTWRVDLLERAVSVSREALDREPGWFQANTRRDMEHGYRLAYARGLGDEALVEALCEPRDRLSGGPVAELCRPVPGPPDAFELDRFDLVARGDEDVDDDITVVYRAVAPRYEHPFADRLLLDGRARRAGLRRVCLKTEPEDDELAASMLDLRQARVGCDLLVGERSAAGLLNASLYDALVVSGDRLLLRMPADKLHDGILHGLRDGVRARADRSEPGPHSSRDGDRSAR